ncbi:hypothetical protein DFP72DRAFT_859034 [Ephemerocybe angulata]|uniref:Uncharacterized protein n=1 Tax=Ephemerocybe angulata TaxID=980116 RepID=A0A8H6HBY6_9AGAR|nr:hypothetical protein DFP72DRAFT_859034 [Tulosesus angulatus]
MHPSTSSLVSSAQSIVKETTSGPYPPALLSCKHGGRREAFGRGGVGAGVVAGVGVVILVLGVIVRVVLGVVIAVVVVVILASILVPAPACAFATVPIPVEVKLEEPAAVVNGPSSRPEARTHWRNWGLKYCFIKAREGRRQSFNSPILWDSELPSRDLEKLPIRKAGVARCYRHGGFRVSALCVSACIGTLERPHGDSTGYDKPNDKGENAKILNTLQ